MFQKLKALWAHEGDTTRERCPYCHQISQQGRCAHCGYDPNDPQATSNLRTRQSYDRARRSAFAQRLYWQLNKLFNFNLSEFLSFLRMSLKWITLGAIVGVLAGTASAIFLISLAKATEIRVAHPWLLWLLPLAGFVTGWFYWRFGGTASKGNNLVIDEVNHNRSRIPLRMAPFVLAGTVITHLFGGSAGREGTAIQMGASLADGLRRVLRLNPADRRLIIMAGIAGGFGSVFGVPTAGFVFGMEVQNVGRIRYEGILPCMVASFVGDFVTRLWGAHHSHYPAMASAEVDPLLMAKVALAGIAFGLTSMLFIELIHGIKHILKRITTWPPLYPVIGGFAIIAMTYLVGTTDYLGLSLPLIHDSVYGVGVVTFAFLLKLLFTTVTLGSGYYGGEVTPLLVIGSTLGFTMGRVLGVDPAFMASIGLVAVFAGASNTPLASAIMGVELLGGGATLYIFLGCTVAYLASGHRGIYATQQVAFAKSFGFDLQPGDNLQTIGGRQQGWLPPLPGVSGTIESFAVQSLMVRHPVVVNDSTTLPDIIALAVAEGVQTMPVVNDQHILVGIITDNDFRRAGFNANLTLLQQVGLEEQLQQVAGYDAITANMIMTKQPVSVGPAESIADAADVMNTHHLKRLPVIDPTNHLLGMITRSDILCKIAVLDPLMIQESAQQLDWHATLNDIDLEAVYTVATDESVDQVVRLMIDHDTRRVVVLEQDQVVGMILDRDLIQRVPHNERPQLIEVLQRKRSLDDVRFSQHAVDVMTAPVVSMRANTPAFLALQPLVEKQLKRLPVLDEDGAVCGMVGRKEIMNVLFPAR